MEPAVEVLVEVLDLAIVRRHAAPGDAGVDERRRHLRLRLANVLLTEQKLSVEVGEINGVHVNNGDVSESHQSQIFQELAAKTSGTDDQNIDVLQQEGEQLGRGSEGGRRQRASSLQNFLQMSPPAWPVTACTVHIHTRTFCNKI